MKCSDINRILDEHSWSSLSAAERSELNAHLVDCSACVESVAAYELLRDEPSARPASGLLHAIVDRLPSEAPRRIERTSPVGWQTVSGLAAMGAIVMIAVFAVIGQQTSEESAPAGVVAPGLAADTIDDTSGRELPPGRVEITPPVFVEGEHFVALPSALPSALQSVEALDRVTAWIFYMWNCLHCYEFEAALSEWIARQDPEAVDVVRVPVQWNPVVTLHARAHYAAELLGISESVSEAFFDSIHERGERLASRDEIAALFAGLGVDRTSFDDAFDSARVTAELERGRSIAAHFGIDATPTIVVDGRYMTSPGLAGSHERATEILDMLVARAEDARGAEPDPVRRSAACDSARNAALEMETLRAELEELRVVYSERHPRVASLQEVLDQIQGGRTTAVDDVPDDCASEVPVFVVPRDER